VRRCNVTDLQSGLEGTVRTLVDAGLPLEALPVIALWEHITLHVKRDLKATVLCRCVVVIGQEFSPCEPCHQSIWRL